MSISTPERQQLRNYLQTRFDLNELKTLAFDIGVDFQLFSHEESGTFSREVISFCERRNILYTLFAGALRQRPDHSVDPLLSKLSPSDDPSIKVQIIVSKENLHDVTEILNELATLFDCPQEEIVLIGATWGSMRLLVSLSKQRAALLMDSRSRSLVSQIFQVISVTDFDALDEVNQETWRQVIYNYPTILQGTLLRPTVSWDYALQTTTKRLSMSNTLDDEQVHTIDETDRKKLREHIDRHFSLDDLKGLAFDLAGDSDVASDDTKQKFIIGLLEYIQQRGLLISFIKNLANQRPKALFFSELVEKLSEIGVRARESQQNTKKMQNLKSKATSAQNAESFDEAISYLEQALEIDPFDKDVIAKLTEVRKKKRQYQAKVLIRRAQSAFNDGDFVEVIQLAQEAIDNDLNNEEAYKLLTLAKKQQRQTEHSIPLSTYTNAPATTKASILPTSSSEDETQHRTKVLIAKGLSAFNAEVFKEAIDLFKQALDITPQNREAQEYLAKAEEKYKASLLQQARQHIEAGRTAQAQSQFLEAFAQFEQAIGFGQIYPDIAQYLSEEKISERLAYCQRQVSLVRELQRAEQLLHDGAYSDALQTIAAFFEPEAEILRQQVATIQRHKQQGQQAWAEQRYADAVDNLATVLATAPRDREAQTLWRRARIFDLMQQADVVRIDDEYERALSLLEQALPLEPTNTALHQAIQETRAKQLHYDTVATWLQQGKEALEAGEHEQAIFLLEKALDSGLSVAQEHAPLLILKARKATQVAQQKRAMELLLQTDNCLNAGNIDEAQTLLQKATNLGETFTELHPALQEATQKLHNFRQVTAWQQVAEEALAQGACEIALEYLQRAQTLALRGQQERLQTLLLQAQIQEKLTQVEAWLLNAEYDPAIEALAWVLAHAPNHPHVAEQQMQAHVQKAASQARTVMGEERFEAAIAILEKAQQEHGDVDSMLQRLLAETRRRLEQSRQVRTVLTIGRSAMAAGDLVEAQKYLEEARVKKPGDSMVLAALEELAQLQNKKHAAIVKQLQEAVEQAMAVEDITLAETHLQRIQEIDESNPILDLLRANIERTKDQLAQLQSFLNEGKEAMAEGNLVHAIGQFEQVAQINWNHPEVKGLLAEARAKHEQQKKIHNSLKVGEQALSKKRFNQALTQSVTVTTVDPLHQEGIALQQQAIAEIRKQVEQFLKENKFSIAQLVLHRPLQLLPNNQELQILQEEIRIVYERYNRRKQLDQQILTARSTAEKVRLLDEAISLTPDDTALISQRQQIVATEKANILVATLLGEAHAYLKYHDYDLAEEKCRQALEIAPAEREREAKSGLRQVQRQRVEQLIIVRQQGKEATQQRKYKKAMEHYQVARNLATSPEQGQELAILIDEVAKAQENLAIVETLLHQARQVRTRKEYQGSPLEIYETAKNNLSKALGIIPDYAEALVLYEANEQDRVACQNGLKQRHYARTALEDKRNDQAVAFSQESVDLFERLGLARERIISEEYLQLARKRVAS